MGIGRKWKEIIDFTDKMTYNAHVSSMSHILVFSELYEASKQRENPWVFEHEYP
jgi:hypothetical protein